jgi:transcriptional regulator of arginine metabolism
MTKNFRQSQILKLIRERTIFTQEELARALKEIGVEATQVTLSRDIRDLGLVKTTEGYRELKRESLGSPFRSLAADFLRGVRQAQNQIVLKTAPGHASSVAVALDNEEWPDVIGTIAGDDTILVVCPDSPTADTVRARLLKTLQE